MQAHQGSHGIAHVSNQSHAARALATSHTAATPVIARAVPGGDTSHDCCGHRGGGSIHPISCVTGERACPQPDASIHPTGGCIRHAAGAGCLVCDALQRPGAYQRLTPPRSHTPNPERHSRGSGEALGSGGMLMPPKVIETTCRKPRSFIVNARIALTRPWRGCARLAAAART